MNVYYVLSEILSVVIPILDDGTGPTEPYAIGILVATTSRSRAKWMAWQTDEDTFCSDVWEMPRFAIRLIVKDIPFNEGIIPHGLNQEFDWLWERVPDIAYPKSAPIRSIR